VVLDDVGEPVKLDVALDVAFFVLFHKLVAPVEMDDPQPDRVFQNPPLIVFLFLCFLGIIY
jgi:hypothetical protein